MAEGGAGTPHGPAAKEGSVMGDDTDKSKARAQQLHRVIERLRAGRPAGAGGGTPAAPPADAGADDTRGGPGGPDLRAAVRRRMRELDEEERGGPPGGRE
ncbi:hypothetical protein BLA24_09485 [Streptomyces cinnamoneus]|uniref:Uncharacterized protein n=2 Tax=Streptomyces cinnamoneus TaxID=53446 RepID=A0A2G1XLT6_STRCJ|nr:hypothetical protein [Streptomyces cinnamoneus]PHQ52141.1 hypothetical protein BLA24_09485 [Streptomyces cinnamoneus]PPT16221.1 hypothetical protein CYQ11_28095 [Streptomyces cinnamoneus]